MNTDKYFDLVRKKAEKIARKYEVVISSVVYIGDNKFIVVKDGKMIRL